MLCECHGEPSRWVNDKRKPSGGYWACHVKERERCRAYYAKHREKVLAQRRAQQLERWHAANGGYVRRRRRMLAEQRQAIDDRLAELAAERMSLD